MRNHGNSGKIEATGIQEAPSALWNVAGWVLALSVFAVAIFLSYQEVHQDSPGDLRTPTILLVDVFLATVVALGFAVADGLLTQIFLSLRIL